AEDAEQKLRPHLLLFLVDGFLGLLVQGVRELLEIVQVVDRALELSPEMLEERDLDSLPIPVLRRLVARAGLFDDRADDGVDEVEQPLALLGEALRDVGEQAVMNGLRLLRIAVLVIEAVAPELVDVLAERLHRVELFDLLDRRRRLLPVDAD